jgi:hypothetical protein
MLVYQIVTLWLSCCVALISVLAKNNEAFFIIQLKLCCVSSVVYLVNLYLFIFTLNMCFLTL